MAAMMTALIYTPDYTLIILDVIRVLLNLTCWVLSVRYAFKHSTETLKPISDNLYKKSLWYSLLNALLKSVYITSVCILLENPLLTIVVSSKISVVNDRNLNVDKKWENKRK